MGRRCGDFKTMEGVESKKKRQGVLKGLCDNIII